MADARFHIDPYDFAAAARLEAALGLSHVTSQILVRRGLADPTAARAFLAADTRHPARAFGGLEDAARIVLRHVEAGAKITVHGDYDVDGVCSTAILIRVLRSLGARVDWYLPSRTEDGYGLALGTVERLAARGTDLLITADCAITAVDEVAAARAAGMTVVVTDHHAPRADGRVPDAHAIVHPRLGANPCPDLCATGVAWKLAGALLTAAGRDPAQADEDLDLVALATVADVVPLHDENRALVRAGLRALKRTRKPGLRALMAVARVDPSLIDATAIGFRLAPRINAAGRIARADAGLELVLTEDEDRAQAVAEELDHLNQQRRDVETRMLFEAEAQAREAGDVPAYVLAGEGWHPGVIGIVAARIAERRFRPCVMIALDGDGGTGSARSIPAFDLLAGLEAGKRHLLRHGGHRAAAGCTIARESVDAFRESFQAHAARVLRPEDLVPVERVDAVACGDALAMPLAEELARLEPFGAGNPSVQLLVPAADPKPMGEEKRHVACSLQAGGARARAVRFGEGATLPDGPVDAAVKLEINHFNGTIEPRVLLRRTRTPGGPIEVVGEPETFAAGVLAELDANLVDFPPQDGADPTRLVRDVRGGGLVSTIADLVATGEPVLVVAAHAAARRRTLSGRLGGFTLTSWHALEREPGLAAGYPHVVALDPPPRDAAQCVQGAGFTHLAWGQAELTFAYAIHEWEYALRDPLRAFYSHLRAAGARRGPAAEQVLRGDGAEPRTPSLAGRLVRVLHELALVSVDRGDLGLDVVAGAPRTALEQSLAFRAYDRVREEGFAWLKTATARAA